MSERKMVNLEYFPVGATLKCKVKANGNAMPPIDIEGKVLAFDENNKFLSLELPASNRKPSNFNVTFVNVDHLVGDVEMDESTVPSHYELLPAINSDKLRKRLDEGVVARVNSLKQRGADVSAHAQRLFDHIAKTISQLRWKKKVIVVFDCVEIAPPYKVEDITAPENDVKASQSLEHIRKIVEKFYSAQMSREPSASSSASSH